MAQPQPSGSTGGKFRIETPSLNGFIYFIRMMISLIFITIMFDTLRETAVNNERKPRASIGWVGTSLSLCHHQIFKYLSLIILITLIILAILLMEVGYGHRLSCQHHDNYIMLVNKSNVSWPALQQTVQSKSKKRKKEIVFSKIIFYLRSMLCHSTVFKYRNRINRIEGPINIGDDCVF